MRTKYSWNLSILLKNPSKENCFNIILKFEKKVNNFVSRWQNNLQYLTHSDILRKTLNEYEELYSNKIPLGNVLFYFSLKQYLNSSDKQTKALKNLITQKVNALHNKLRFFALSLGEISETMQKKFLKDDTLKSYHFFLQKIFLGKTYQLSLKEENIISLKSRVAYSNWINLTTGLLNKSAERVLDEDGKVKIKNLSEIVSLSSSQKKEVRDSANKKFNKILKENLEIAENEINSILENKRIDDEIRKTPRPDFLQHLEDDIPTQNVDALISAVKEKFNISKEFYKLKAKALGVKKLEYHERNVEVGNIKVNFSFESSIKILKTVLKKLDPEFEKILSGYLKNGQIDVYPQKGKENGAFCAAYHKDLPVFVLLNHTNRINDLRTFAHEMGHAIHYEYAKTQNNLYFGASTATAEVASTFFEDFVIDEIEQNLKPKEKFYLKMAHLNDIVSTVFRQAACYLFELELHKSFREKGYLTYIEIGKIFQKNMKLYMGDFVEQSRGSENWWVYWKHIRTFFYVYSYASGSLISKALQALVKQNPKSISSVKDFFKAGQSDNVQSIFLKAGITIAEPAFWNSGIAQIESLLNEANVLFGNISR